MAIAVIACDCVLYVVVVPVCVCGGRVWLVLWLWVFGLF